MNENRKISVNFRGCGFTLAIIFFVLKLTQVIDWAWIWVFAPIWIPLALILFIYIFTILIGIIVTAIRGY